MHEVLVNRLGGLSLPRKSVVRLTDRPDMTLDVYRGRKTTIKQTNKLYFLCLELCFKFLLINIEKHLKLVAGFTFNSFLLRLVRYRNWGLMSGIRKKINFSFESKTS